MLIISAFNILLANVILIISPSFILVEGFATLSFINIRPLSHTSFATVLLFMIRDTFKYLSNLIFSPLLKEPEKNSGSYSLCLICILLLVNFIFEFFTSFKYWNCR